MEILSNQGLLLSPSVSFHFHLIVAIEGMLTIYYFIPRSLCRSQSTRNWTMTRVMATPRIVPKCRRPMIGERTSGGLQAVSSRLILYYNQRVCVCNRSLSLSLLVSSKGTPLSSTASNKPHSSSQQMKQQLPLKLSSLSSGSRSNSVSSPVTSPQVGSNFGGTPTTSRNDGPAQMFPLKLADKKGQSAPQPPMVSHHSRTGSSPAVIQQNAYQVGNAGRTNTYPKVPDRVRIRSTDGSGQVANSPQMQAAQQGIHLASVGAVMGQKRAPPPQQQHQAQHYHAGGLPPQQQHHHPHHPHGQTPPQPPPRHFEKEATNKEEEVIYF